MADMSFFKMPNGVLCPADPQTEERLKKVKIGQVMQGDFRKVRNYEFHKKYFALLNYAFDMWQPILGPEAQGIEPEKNFDRFRQEVQILAGYYETVHSFDGRGFKLVSKSISFANMDEIEFGELFSAVIDVILQRIIPQSSREQIEAAVDEVLRFA